MKLLLIGASGMIGTRVLAEAVSRGHSVTAAVRNPAKVQAGPGVTAAALDATDADAVAALAADVDAIVVSVSPRGGGDPMVEAKAVSDAVMEAAKRTGKRLFYVGGAGSLTLPDGSSVADTLPDLYRGEALSFRAVRDRLKASDLDWTYFSPAGTIAPGEKTGTYQSGTTALLFGEDGQSRISAEDYANALVDELENPAHKRGQMTIAY